MFDIIYVNIIYLLSILFYIMFVCHVLHIFSLDILHQKSRWRPTAECKSWSRWSFFAHLVPGDMEGYLLHNKSLRYLVKL